MTDTCPNCGFHVELSPRERRTLLTEGRLKDAVIEASRQFTESNFPYGIRQLHLKDLHSALAELDAAQVGQKPVDGGGS